VPEPRHNARRRITDAEVVTLCVAQAIMGIPSGRRFLADAIEWHMAQFAQQSPGCADELLLIDSTSVECGRSRETAKRSALGEVAGYGSCATHSRWFRGLRLHALCAPDGTLRALTLADRRRFEREVALGLLERAANGGEALMCDKGYSGRAFAVRAPELGLAVARPRRADEGGAGPQLCQIRQRIEHGARDTPCAPTSLASERPRSLTCSRVSRL